MVTACPPVEGHQLPELKGRAAQAGKAGDRKQQRMAKLRGTRNTARRKGLR